MIKRLKFLRSLPPRRRDGDTSERNSAARSEDRNSHKKAQDGQKKSGVALLDRGSPNPHGAEGDSPPRIADLQVRIPPQAVLPDADSEIRGPRRELIPMINRLKFLKSYPPRRRYEHPRVGRFTVERRAE